jgi:hypothetical protein
MKRAMLAAAALLCTVATVPSFAALDRLGEVNFSQRDTHDARLGNFKAESMALIAQGSDVLCDRVVATYGDGRQGEIFRGTLPQGETVRIHLPRSSVDRVDFDCRPADGYRASVAMAADDGRYPNQRFEDRRFHDRYYDDRRYDDQRYDDRFGYPDER